MLMAQRGVGDEFFSLKNYEQGDDPRMLSWRRLAKTGRLYVKENESTQGGVIWLVLEDPIFSHFLANMSQLKKPSR